MSQNIRKPMITAPTAEGQITQIKSYLIQLVEQLNFALQTLESGAGNVSPTTAGEAPLKLTQGLFSEIKSLIMKSSDIVNAYFSQMEPLICESEKLFDKIGEEIEGHDTSEVSHTDIRNLIEELTEEINSLEGGEDGVSPTVEVSKTGSVTTITITDVNGPQTATINDGEKGETGAPGPQGEKGDKGDTGETGPQGIQGIQGDKGDQGEPGLPGYTPIKGVDYFDGVSATHSWNGTVLTITSASGTSSADLKGEKGDKGDTGADGAQGPQGLQGEKGEPGADGAQGPKGDTGDIGPQGPKGDTGEVGPQGPVGPTGPIGPTGPQGPQGDKGDKGADGYTPVKGIDFYTEADKAEMVDLVIAALPRWSGGSY